MFTLPSKCMDTNAPGIGGLHGKNKGRPSSITPVNLLQMGFTPKSGRLLPTLTTIVASLFLAESKWRERERNSFVKNDNNNTYKLIKEGCTKN